VYVGTFNVFPINDADPLEPVVVNDVIRFEYAISHVDWDAVVGNE
jgi:hypothetical protein